MFHASSEQPSILDVVAAIEKFFENLDQSIRKLQQQSALSCLAGCDRCCRHPEVEVSMAEMLPAAYQIYRSGQAESVYRTLEFRTEGICFFFDTKLGPQGSCQSYPKRPALCRLFGFAAVRDKHGQARLATCRPIKQVHAQAAAAIDVQLRAGSLELELLSDIQLRLRAIDARLEVRPRPINQALRMALQWLSMRLDYASEPSPSDAVCQQGGGPLESTFSEPRS